MSEKKWKAPNFAPQYEENDEAELWSRVSQADLLKASGAESSKTEEKKDTSLDDILKLDLSFLNETEDAAILEQARQAKEADQFLEETAEELGGILQNEFAEEPVLPPTESASADIVETPEEAEEALPEEQPEEAEEALPEETPVLAEEPEVEPEVGLGHWATVAQPDEPRTEQPEEEAVQSAEEAFPAETEEASGTEEAEPAEETETVKKTKKEKKAEEAARREQEAQRELLTDEEAFRKKQHKKKVRNFLLNGVMVASTAVFLVCAVELGVYFYQSMRYQASMEELRSSIGGGISEDMNSKIENQTQENGDMLVFPDEETYEVISATKQENIGANWADQYATLVEKNSDCFGYIEIPDTVLSYPVMFTPEDYMYYLDKNIDREKEKRGLPFMDEATKIGESQNYLVYGHNMNDTTAFGSLREYLDKAYYEEHKYIYFNTAVSEGVYEIMAVVKTKIYNVEDQCFKYHKYGGVLTEKEFNTYVSEMIKASVYRTGVTAKWGDQLLTLSTCNRYTENGRLVIVARRIA